MYVFVVSSGATGKHDKAIFLAVSSRPSKTKEVRDTRVRIWVCTWLFLERDGGLRGAIFCVGVRARASSLLVRWDYVALSVWIEHYSK